MKKLLIVLFVFLLGCMETPIPPSWDTTLNLPLASRNIIIRDIIEDTLSPDSLSLLREGYEIDTIWVGDLIKLDSLESDTFLVLQDIPINKSYRNTVFFTLGELLPWLAPYQGQIVDSVPDTSFTISDTINFTEDFETVTIDSGYLTLRVSNEFPIEIDSLNITIIAHDTLEIKFPYISAGGNGEETYDLAGHTLSDSCSLIVDGWTRTAYSVLIDTTDCIKFDAELMLRRIKSMIGKFPACTTDVSFSLDLKTHRINIAVIASGTFNLQVWNPVHSEFDWFLKGDDCSFLPYSCHIMEQGNDFILEIQNDTIKPVDPDSIKLGGTLSTDGGTVVDTIDQQDTFFIKLKLNNLIFSELDGFIDTVITETIPEVGQSIDYYDCDLSVIVFDSALLYFDVWNEVEASPQVDLVMTGIRGADFRTFHISKQLTYGHNEDKIGGDTITNFLNFFPESINVTGEISLWGDIRVEASDRVFGEIGLMVPIDFTLNDTLIVEPDTVVSFEVPAEIGEMTILETKLLTYIHNTTPLKGDVRVYLSPDSASLGPPLFVINFVEGTFEQLQDISIGELLKSENLWAKAKVRLFPADVRVFVRDKLIVKTLLRVKTKVGG